MWAGLGLILLAWRRRNLVFLMCLLIQASLQLCRKDAVFEEFLSSVFFIYFFPNGHRSSWLAKAGWDRKLNSVHRPTLGRHQTAGFLMPKKLLVFTCWQWPAQNQYIRDDVCPNCSMLSQITLHHETHRRLHWGAASLQGKWQWIKLCSFTGETLQGTVFKHQVWKRFCSSAGSLLRAMHL